MLPMQDGWNGQVVGINNSPMFDEIAHTQGGCPHLMQYLWDKYVQYLQKKIEERRASKRPVVEIGEAIKKAPALGFVDWASKYLKENRVVQNFFVDENHGLVLSNNDNVVVCPGMPVMGTMQNSGAIGVTEGRSREGNEGVIFDPNASLRI